MKAESAFGVVENELRDCRELKKETVELQGAVVDDVKGRVAEPVVREVLVSSVVKVEGGDQKSALRVRRADQTFVAAQGGVPSNVPRVRSPDQTSVAAQGGVPPNVPRVWSADQTSVAAQGGVPPNVPRVRSADQPEEDASVDKVAKDAQVVQAGSGILAHAEEGPPADIDVLYHTLVRDGALPKGFEREFATQAHCDYGSSRARKAQNGELRKMWKRRSGCRSEKRGSS